MKRNFGFADLLFKDDKVYFMDKRGLKYRFNWKMQNYIMLAEWEKASVDYAEKRLAIGESFIDIGAHIGHFSLPLARKEINVTAFEPHSGIASLLEDNIKENGLCERIVLEKMAVSDKCEEVMLTNNRFGGNRLAIGDMDNVKVPSVTLDEYVEKKCIKNIKMIKADIEGAELMLLDGAANVLADHGPELLFEVDEHHLAHFGATPKELFDYLKSKGYGCKKAFEDDQVFDTEQFLPEGDTRNYLFVKSVGA